MPPAGRAKPPSIAEARMWNGNSWSYRLLDMRKWILLLL